VVKSVCSERLACAGAGNEPVANRLLVGTILLPIGGVTLVSLPLGECNVHIVSQLAGFADALDGCDGVSGGEFARSLAPDARLAVVYGVVGVLALRRTWRGWRLGRLRALNGVVPWLPLAAAGLDLIEGGLMFVGVEHEGALRFRSDVWAEAIAGAAWAKWSLLVLAAAATSLAASWFNSARAKRPVLEPVATDHPGHDPDDHQGHDADDRY
jgi:hypothetical protein